MVFDIGARIRMVEGDEEQLQALKDEVAKIDNVNDLIQLELARHALSLELYGRDLWAVAYLTNGGCGDDGFADFRGWLVWQGKDLFEMAQTAPDDLTPFLQAYKGYPGDESFSYVVSEALEAAGCEDDLEYARHPSQPFGDDWDDNDDVFAKRFPKAFAAFRKEQP